MTVFADQNAARGSVVYNDFLAAGAPAEAARLALYYEDDFWCEHGTYGGLIREPDIALYGDDHTLLKGV